MLATKVVSDCDQVQVREVNIVCRKRGKVRANQEACNETGLTKVMEKHRLFHLCEGKVLRLSHRFMMESCMLSLQKESTVASIIMIYDEQDSGFLIMLEKHKQ